MMNVLRKVAIAVGATVVLLLLIGFLLPAHVHIERSVTIASPPEPIYELVATTKRWPEWAAWKPTKWEFPGAESGVGAESKWEDKSGNGYLKITAAEPQAGIEYQFQLGSDAPAPGSIKFTPAGKGETKVTWNFDCEMGMNPIGRYFGFFAMDSLIGKDFATGLANLKAKVESEQVAPPPAKASESKSAEASPTP